MMRKKGQVDNEKEMNLVGHLSELRNRIIVTGLFFVAFFIIAFIYVKDIYRFLEGDIDFSLAITSPTEVIWIYVSIAAIVATIGTLPVFSLQLWLFIKPGLKSNERKASLSYIPPIFFLFVIGLVFGYLLFSNFILPFLISLNDDMFIQLFTVDKYYRFMFQIMLIFGILFEVPVITMFLTSLGILSPAFLKKTRKYAYFVLLIVSALVTPPDIFLQLVVAVPLFLLYEISIYFSNVVYKRKEKKHKAFMNEN
ncbi:MAG TPA: twin-arginine translocase subunit TatC [Candidatus Dormibacteraeota bacterium]|nr:twin-arginine translocase subunit TatC [Candidatus Dormibacteraeota bacterium]